MTVVGERNNEDTRIILDTDATGIAQLIRNKELSIVEVVSIYIEHIKKINPIINAMVEDRFATALTEAKEMDAQGDMLKGPLHGVPISVKESYHVRQMKTTGGLIHRQDLIEKQDAEVVKKLKQAGAIVLGKTNTPTLCFCQETVNKLYGQTNNSWDQTRTAGGSSGGEGALLGLGGAAVGIGSDIGGSIRFPCHFNGVIGFKSGKYQISQEGHFPHNSIPLQEQMLGFGPMGKSVRDMELLYSIIAKEQPTEQTLEEYTIDIIPGENGYPLSEKTKAVLKQIGDFLKTSYKTKETLPPFFDQTALLWQEIMSIDGGESVRKIAFPFQQTNYIKEYIKEKTMNNAQVHSYLSWALIGARLFKPSYKRIQEIEEYIQQGNEKLTKYLKNRLIIFPVYHSGAPKHGVVFQEIFSIKKTFLQYMPFVAYANVWGLPSLVIPVGVDESNMPISIQIMGLNGNEDAIFKLGKVIEKKFRGYKRSNI